MKYVESSVYLILTGCLSYYSSGYSSSYNASMSMTMTLLSPKLALLSCILSILAMILVDQATNISNNHRWNNRNYSQGYFNTRQRDKSYDLDDDIDMIISPFRCTQRWAGQDLLRRKEECICTRRNCDCIMSSLLTGSTLVPLFISSLAYFVSSHVEGSSQVPIAIYIEIVACSAAAFGLCLVFALLFEIVHTSKYRNKQTRNPNIYSLIGIFALLNPVINAIVLSLIHVVTHINLWQHENSVATVSVFVLTSSLLLLYVKGQYTNQGCRLPLTVGEMSACLNLFGLLVSDFASRYIVRLGVLYYKSQASSDIPIETDFLAVSQSGIVGCFLGLALSITFLSHFSILVRCTLICGCVILCCEIGLRAIHPIQYCDLYSFSTLVWLINFLTASDGNTHHLKNIVSISGLVHLTHMQTLFYWACVLCITVPISSVLSNQTNVGAVIVRKYFHGIALLLFLPVSLFSPSMMSLSYAISFSILLVLEWIRNNVYNKGDDEADTRTLLRRLCHTVNQFYAAFLDEKDFRGGNFVVTHISLILGCALPCWTFSLIQCVGLGDKYDFGVLLRMLGVLSIGVGDSFGALVGLTFGRCRWPGSNRTIEGTLALACSMLVSMYFFTNNVDQSLIIITVLVALLEAATDQVDNLVLPVVGIVALLIFST